MTILLLHAFAILPSNQEVLCTFLYHKWLAAALSLISLSFKHTAHMPKVSIDKKFCITASYPWPVPLWYQGRMLICFRPCFLLLAPVGWRLPCGYQPLGLVLVCLCLVPCVATQLARHSGGCAVHLASCEHSRMLHRQIIAGYGGRCSVGLWTELVHYWSAGLREAS